MDDSIKVIDALVRMTQGKRPVIPVLEGRSRDGKAEYLPVLADGDYDFGNLLERVEWKYTGDALTAGPPYCVYPVDFIDTPKRLIPDEDFTEWRRAMLHIAFAALASLLDVWVIRYGSTISDMKLGYMGWLAKSCPKK